jgi:hypothetical protein
MSLAGFEPMIQVHGWEKTVHALDSTITVIGGFDSRKGLTYSQVSLGTLN